jgi:hypothetical protein
MGLPVPLTADARFTRAGFELNLAGQATLAKLLPAAANFGLLENASTLVAPKGRATLKTTTTGNWMRPLAGSGSGIGTNGTLKVEGAELRPAFLPAPVEVESAEITLTPEEIAWQNVALAYQTMALRGSIQFPTQCNQPVACPASFTLAADSLDAATVEAALGGKSSGFLGFFSNALGGGNGAKWPALRGQIQCATLRLGKLPLRGVTGALSVEGNKLTLSSLDATALGGALRASGEMAIQDGAPHWTLSIRVADATGADIGPIFGEPWGSGTLNGETHLTLNGYRAQDLASSAKGDFAFTWQNGSLPAPERSGRFSAGAFRTLDGERHHRRWCAGADRRRRCKRGEDERGSRDHRVRPRSGPHAGDTARAREDRRDARAAGDAVIPLTAKTAACDGCWPRPRARFRRSDPLRLGFPGT